MRTEAGESPKSLAMVEFALYFAMRQQQAFVSLSSTPKHEQVKFLEETMTNN